MIRQNSIVRYLARNIIDSVTIDIDKKRYAQNHLWPTIIKFRYFDELYKVAPQLFPDISQAKFEKTRKEFYDSQPITLSLPLG